MIRSSQLVGLPIIAIQEAKEVGKVRDLVIDAAEKRVQALLVEDAEWFRNPKALLYSSVRAVGEDAVMIDNHSDMFSLSSRDDLDLHLSNPVKVIDTRVLSANGRFLGRISQLFINTDNGEITGCEVCSPSTTQKPLTIPSEKIRALTSDLILTDEVGIQPTYTSESTLKTADTRTPTATHAAPRREAMISRPAPERTTSASPAPTISPASASTLGEGGIRRVLEERQDAYLLGKEVRRDVFADDGTVLIKAGQTISDEVIEKAKEADKYLALSFSIRRT